MRPTLHPEYGIYQGDLQASERCRRAVAAWRASGAPLVVPSCNLSWTPAQAQAFVRSLGHMFRAYNQVLWERFPYCRSCEGQCCALGAARADGFDLLALALLDETLPVLAGEVLTAAGWCIYLVHGRCSWPASWRTVKCWAFYCLGGERDAGPDRPHALAAALAPIVRQFLPRELCAYEHSSGETLAASLGEPLQFAHALCRAASAILVRPLHERYPLLDQGHTPAEMSPEAAGAADELAELPGEQVLQRIGQVYERLAADSQSPSGPELPLDQVLADLELLEWICYGMPADGVRMLDAMYGHYQDLPAARKGGWSVLALELCDLVTCLRARYTMSGGNVP